MSVLLKKVPGLLGDAKQLLCRQREYEGRHSALGFQLFAPSCRHTPHRPNQAPKRLRAESAKLNA